MSDKNSEKKSSVEQTNESVLLSHSSIIIEKIVEFISKVKDSEISLLRNPDVIRWIFGDLSFLPSIEKSKNKSKDRKKKKALEDTWGRKVLKIRRPDLKLDKQWTNKFGEYICQEIFILLGKAVSKPVKMKNYEPDLEIDDAIVEIKTQTYYTDGTAGEKILGCPFKYAPIPNLYAKPLNIVCVGGAEKICREQYGNLPGKNVECFEKKEFLEFYLKKNIKYVGACDLLISLVN